MKPSSVEISQLEVVLQNVVLSMGLTINAITIHGQGIRIEPEPLQVKLSTPGDMEALLLAPNIADFLEKQAPGGLKNFEVELKDDRIYVQANIMIMKGTAVCTLRIVDGKQLFIDLETVDVLGIGAKNMVQSQLDKVNPVLDVKDLPVPVTLTSYSTEEGKLVLRGTIHSPTQ